MEIAEVLDLINGKVKYKYQCDKLKRHEDVFFGMSLHTRGVTPYFTYAGQTIMPMGWFHERYQLLFKYFLLNRHPRESDETLNWRFSRYKPLTKAPFQTVTELVTGAIFQDGNYSIDIPDQQDKDYIFGNNFHGTSLVGYYANKGYKHMIEDPNGLFVRVPRKPFYEYVVNEEVEVDIWFISSCDIKHLTDDDVVFRHNGFYWHIDRNTIWRYTEGDTGWKLYDEEGYYAHMMGKLPVSIAQGEWNSAGYYDSFYDKAKAAADVYIDTFSSQQLVDKNASHPFIIESAEDCPTCNGIGKFQNCGRCHYTTDRCICDDQTQWSLTTCGTCNGSTVIASDPSKRKIVPADQLKDGQHVQIVSPDVNVNKHHIELCREIMTAIKEALHLNLIDQAQSGKAKALDQDRQYKFISKISNHIFDDLISESIYDIIAYRHVVASPEGVRPAVYPFKIIKPQQFDIRTAYELLEELEKATTSGAPKYVLGKQLYDFTDKQYSGDDIIRQKVWFIGQYDPYAMHKEDELISIKVLGGINQEQIILHYNLPVIFDSIVRDKGEEWVLDADYNAIAAEVEARKATYLPTVNPLQQKVNETLRIDA